MYNVCTYIEPDTRKYMYSSIQITSKYKGGGGVFGGEGALHILITTSIFFHDLW